MPDLHLFLAGAALTVISCGAIVPPPQNCDATAVRHPATDEIVRDYVEAMERTYQTLADQGHFPKTYSLLNAQFSHLLEFAERTGSPSAPLAKDTGADAASIPLDRIEHELNNALISDSFVISLQVHQVAENSSPYLDVLLTRVRKHHTTGIAGSPVSVFLCEDFILSGFDGYVRRTNSNHPAVMARADYSEGHVIINEHGKWQAALAYAELANAVLMEGTTPSLRHQSPMEYLCLLRTVQDDWNAVRDKTSNIVLDVARELTPKLIRHALIHELTHLWIVRSGSGLNDEYLPRCVEMIVGDKPHHVMGAMAWNIRHQAPNYASEERLLNDLLTELIPERRQAIDSANNLITDDGLAKEIGDTSPDILRAKAAHLMRKVLGKRSEDLLKVIHHALDDMPDG